MPKCTDSERAWSNYLQAAKGYLASLEKQISAIAARDLTFPRFDSEIKKARRYFGMARNAVINHHRLHGCSEHTQAAH